MKTVQTILTAGAFLAATQGADAHTPNLSPLDAKLEKCAEETMLKLAPDDKRISPPKIYPTADGGSSLNFFYKHAQDGVVEEGRITFLLGDKRGQGSLVTSVNTGPLARNYAAQQLKQAGTNVHADKTDFSTAPRAYPELASTYATPEQVASVNKKAKLLMDGMYRCMEFKGS